MKRHPTPLWPGWNLSYHYQQAACSKQHGGSTVTVVVAAPTSWTPPPNTHTHTPAEQSPYHSSLFPIKMSAKSQESHGAESLAGLDHSRGLVHREARWTRSTDKDGHDTPETRTYTRCLIHTGSSLSLSALGSGIHLQASLLALLEVPAGSSLPLYGNRCRRGRVRHHREKFLMEIHDQDGCRGWIRTQTATTNCILQVLKTSSSSSAFISPG